MTITLRPHQKRIVERLAKYDKGQCIVPTGGGKTLTMIMDLQRTLDNNQSGTTTVVVAPRILLAEQLILCMFTRAKHITSALQKQTRLHCLLIVLVLLVRT
jgi:superfamily II DNA or RNA helicase